MQNELRIRDLLALLANCWFRSSVDTICIDQTNDSERNAQVRLMDKT